MLSRRTILTSVFALTALTGAYAQVTSGGALMNTGTAPNATGGNLPAGAVPGVNTTIGVPIVEQGTATQILSNQGFNTSPSLATQNANASTTSNPSGATSGGAGLPITSSSQASFPAVTNAFLQGLTVASPNKAPATTMVDASSVLDGTGIAVYVQTLNANTAAAANARALTQSYRAQNLIGADESIIGLSNGQAFKVSGSVLSTSATQLR